MNAAVPPAPAVVLADDLTGAAEVAAFVGSAQEPALLTWRPELPVEGSGNVLVLDTETRNMSASDARRSILRLTAQPGFPRGGVYKKIDSTLRGPISAELDALMAAQCTVGGSGGSILLAPAYPRMGRVTQAGMQLADGVPVTEGPAGTDPLAPARTARLINLLPAGLEPVILPPPAGAVDELAAELLRLRNAGRAVIVDITREEHLARLASALVRTPFSIVVGSGGLARYMWGFSAQEGRTRPTGGARPPLLIAAGSLNPVLRTQVDQLRRDFSCLHWTPPMPMKPLPEPPPEALVVSTPQERTDPYSALEDLVGALEEVIRAARPEAVLVTGGETALRLLDRLQAKALEVTGELVDGLPIGRLAGGPYAGLLVATKAGGFGDRYLLRDAAQELLNPDAGSPAPLADQQDTIH